MITLILEIEYDGTDFCGWQIQPNGRTVMEDIEKAIAKVFGQNVRLVGAGRTDAGVHAKAMTASSILDFIPRVEEAKAVNAINSQLSQDVRIKKAIYYNGKFHARFDAMAREYSYHLLRKVSVFQRKFAYNCTLPIDEEILFKSAELFLGKRDFTTFSKINPSIKNNICDVQVCNWEKVSADYYILHIKADHFLYGMVRSITGAMLEAARNYKSLEEIKAALESCDRFNNSVLAPAHGLFFEKAYYPETFKLSF
ncbi:MAG: tRNA pseudouridine(38-40) synthase TruA [bacterium]